MKHSTMKIMSLILALCMIMSLMPMSVLAEGETTHTVTLALTNVTADPASPITVNDGDNCDITLTPADGYALPTSVTVDGVTLNATSSETPIESANYYAANGGEGSPTGINYNTGDEQVTLAAPTKTGYDFAGWLTSGSATGAFAPSQTLRGDITIGTGSYGNATLTAQWTPKVITVTLDDGSGTTTIYEKYGVGWYSDLACSTAITAVELPAMTGYTFAGYSGLTDAQGDITADDTTYYANAVVNASWTANSTIVSFNLNGGDGTAPANVTETYNENVASVNVPSRTGYTFAGWYDADEGGNQVFTAAGAFNGTTWNIENFSLTVYAQWNAVTYTVTLNPNSGTAGTASFEVAFGQTVSIQSYIAATRTGYELDGWYSDAAGTTKVLNADGTAVTGAVDGWLTTDGKWNKAENTTLYAKWTGATQTNTLPGDGTVTQTGTTKTGDTVTLTVNPDDGKKIETLTVTPTGGGDPIAITPNTFATDDSTQTFTYTQPAGPVTVAVTYSNINYTVSYSVPGGVTVSGGTTSFNVDSTSITLPTALTRSGYTFDGWTIGRTGNVGTVNGGSSSVAAAATSIDLARATGNLTLTAKWTATNNELTVSVSDANASASGTATFAISSGITTNEGRYYISAEADAKFTVALAAGYKIVSVTYQIGSNAATQLTPADGVYTIPAAAAANPVTLRITTSIDSAKITANAAIANGAFQTYSQYSGNKSLVLFNVTDSNIVGLALSNGVSVNKTSAYAGYQYAALLNLTGVTDKTQDGLNAYLQSLLMTKSSANTTLDYNKNVNGKGAFTIDDVSVEYDYTSRSSLNWVPYDAYLIIGDIAGNGSSSADRVLDAYDVAAFVAAH